MKLSLILGLLLVGQAAFAKDISVKVSGMVCSMCAQGIKKKFSQIKEVKEINVNLDTKIVSIKTNEDQDLKDEKIKEIITEAGYNVASIERK
ncbi:MAG TPA: heavy metal-associated domain-containing protein [Bacteriovoracaceae bacterium]|nr:heavy metal-associated domain-containing protein [Bacteriovoracaceae bacterium]